MQFTYIFRHRKENLKKCSLQPLVGREDLQFINYPLRTSIELPSNTVVLSFDGPPLSEKDKDSNLVLIDATWNLAMTMEKGLAPFIAHLPKRSLPPQARTAYPRRQTGCLDPDRGLASIEALYLAYRAVGRDTNGLLDHYYWKEQFLQSLENLEM